MENLRRGSFCVNGLGQLVLIYDEMLRSPTDYKFKGCICGYNATNSYTQSGRHFISCESQFDIVREVYYSDELLVAIKESVTLNDLNEVYLKYIPKLHEKMN